MKPYAAWLLNHRAWVVGVILFFSLSSAVYAFFNARINSDLGSLIKPSENLSWFQDNEVFKSQFPMFEQTALLVVSGERASAVINAARQLAREVSADPAFSDVFAPDTAGFIASHQWYYLSAAELEQWLLGVEYGYGAMLRLSDDPSIVGLVYTLADHLSANRGLPLPPALAQLAQGLPQQDTFYTAYPALADPELETHYRVIVVKGQQQLDQELPNAEIVKRLRYHIDSARVAADVKIRLTGEVPLAHEEISAALDGVEIAGLVSLVLLALILGVGIRSPGFVLAVFAVLILGVLLTLGLSVALVGSFNTLSLIFVVMFFGLGVDFTVHFGLRLLEAAKAQAMEGALESALRDVGPAIALCMLTSMVAFLSFVPTAYVGLGELGVMSALGMAVAFLLTISLLPVLLSFVNLSNQGEKATARSSNWVRWFSVSRPTLISFLFLTMGGLYFAKDLSFDYSVLSMRDVETEGMQALLDLQGAGITTDYSIAVLASSKLHAAELTKKLRELELVGNVLGPEQLIPDRQMEKQALVLPWLERYQQITEVQPTDGDTAALRDALEYLRSMRGFATEEDRLTLDRLIVSLEAVTDEQVNRVNEALLNDTNRALAEVRALLAAKPFSVETLPKNLARRFITDNDQYLLRVQPKGALSDRESTTRFIQQVDQVAPNIAGRSVVEWGIGGVVVESFIQACATALVAILLILVLYFRGLLFPALVLLPIVVTIILTFALCELFAVPLNMANILVVPLIIGLGVDTGIHVVHRMREGGVTGLFQSSTTKAVVISGLTTVGTFFSLSFSPHLGAASIGQLLTVAISLLLVVTFGLLPAVVHELGLDRS